MKQSGILDKEGLIKLLIYLSFFCYLALVSEFFSRVFNGSKPTWPSFYTFLLLICYFISRSSDEYTRFMSLDPGILLREKGVLFYGMSYISTLSGIPEMGYLLLILIFFCA